jgi:glyoxylase-like metal-dependent hydrolase (beta-lactamase superfamily II)
MSLTKSSAIVKLTGIAPLSQSRQHDEPKLEGESHEEYDKRTWRSKLNVSADGETVVIPAHGVQQALIAAARYSGKQIPGQGKKTWTKKFEGGITLFEDPRLNVHPDNVQSVTISANADGQRGSGKRVPRRFPIIHQWETEFELVILDPIIGADILQEMLEISGMFVGLGRFRPENGGLNGRFSPEIVRWNDRRQLVA